MHGKQVTGGSFMNRTKYVHDCYKAAAAAAKYYAERQDHNTAERFWRDADGWRKYAWLNGFDVRAV